MIPYYLHPYIEMNSNHKLLYYTVVVLEIIRIPDIVLLQLISQTVAD